MISYDTIPLYEVTCNLKEHKQLTYEDVEREEKLSSSVSLVGEVIYEFKDIFKDFTSKADALKLRGDDREIIIAVKQLAGITEDDEEISLHFEEYADYYVDDYDMTNYIRTIRFSKKTLKITYDVEEAVDMFSRKRKLHKKSKVMI